MCDQDLSTYLWEESSNTNVYIQNISPNSIMGEKTPEKIFTGEKPNVEHLNIFGCLVYIDVPKEKRTNMDSSEKKWNFVVYSKSSKAYRIYVPSERHIEVNKDVTFHEDVIFKRSKEIQCDSNMEEHETPMMEDLVYGSPHSDVERENLEESLHSLDL